MRGLGRAHRARHALAVTLGSLNKGAWLVYRGGRRGWALGKIIKQMNPLKEMRSLVKYIFFIIVIFTVPLDQSFYYYYHTDAATTRTIYLKTNVLFFGSRYNKYTRMEAL